MSIQEILNRHQSVFKRPLPRPPRGPAPPFVRPTKGVVHDILNLKQYVELEPKPLVAQERTEEYFRLLKRNYEDNNLVFKKPYVIESQTKHKVVGEPESHIDYLDQVQVRLTVLKTGKVRVKCVLHGAQMYEKYYSQGKAPPMKTITTAYKNLGYSETFIQSMTEKHKKRVLYGKKVGKILDAIFEKSGGAKKKKAKVEEVKKVEEEEPDEEEDPEEEDGPEEDEALVADDEEEEEEEVIEEDLDLE